MSAATSSESYTMNQGYNYDSFQGSANMALYMDDPNYAVPVHLSSFDIHCLAHTNLSQTTQMEWPVMDATSYPANDNYSDSIGSFTEPILNNPPIEIQIGPDGSSNKKRRHRPNRYKDAHPMVKEVRLPTPTIQLLCSWFACPIKHILTVPCLQRRREQNREAQRKYRERKDQRIIELEGLLQASQQQHQTLTQAYVDLHAEYENLLRQTTQSPSEINTDEDPAEGSNWSSRS